MSSGTLEEWRCPVEGCGHVMKKGSAGIAAHFRRRHTQLVLSVCPSACRHGCTVCVPRCVREFGEAATPVQPDTQRNPDRYVARNGDALEQADEADRGTAPRPKKSRSQQNKSDVSATSSTAPLKRKLAESHGSAKKLALESSLHALEDAPSHHKVHKMKLIDGVINRCKFVYKKAKFSISFGKQTSKEEALRITRLCYMRFEELDPKTPMEAALAKDIVIAFKMQKLGKQLPTSTRTSWNGGAKSLVIAKMKAKQKKRWLKPKSILGASVSSEQVETEVFPVPEIEDACNLEATDLHKLLCQGVKLETLLRGVSAEKQEQVLALFNDAACGEHVSDDAEEHHVTLGALPWTSDAEFEFSGVPDQWSDLAEAQGVDWPEQTFAPSFSRVGQLGGLGMHDDFKVGVVAGGTGTGVTRLLMKLAEQLQLPASPVMHVRSNQAIASYLEDAVTMLPLVGLNSVPAWMRPYHVLSNGQQQRFRLARYIGDGAVIDDFGSGMDEQEINSVAHALSRFIKNRSFSKILIGTHAIEAIAYLQPDFVVWTNGEWCVNPNPYNARNIQVCLRPLFMGPALMHPSDGHHEDPLLSGPFHFEDEPAWAGAVHVKRSDVEVKVEVDRRTLDAANAFECEFTGTAKCSIPVLPQTHLPPDWFMGLIVGPSGSGKTTTVQNLCRENGFQTVEHDAFDPRSTVFSLVASVCGSADIAMRALDSCTVSKDCWLRRFSCLSRSEAWRVSLAHRFASVQTQTDASCPRVVVIDEFTTQLDRSHAKSLCLALKAYTYDVQIRVIFATVHADVAAWLCPQWIFDTGRAEFVSAPTLTEKEDCVRRVDDVLDPSASAFWKPPTLTLDIQMVDKDSRHLLWKRHFKEHHYLTGTLSGRQDGCFVVRDLESSSMVAFHATSMLPGAQTWLREHRLVVLPSWQGFGIGPRLSNFLGARWAEFGAEKGQKFSSRTAHPRLGELRQRDPHWKPLNSNLKVSDAFGDIGFGERAVQKFKMILPHGTLVSVTRQNHLLASVKDWSPSVDIPLPPDVTNENLEQVLGITFKSSTLIVASFFGELCKQIGAHCNAGWALRSVNAEDVMNLQELCSVLKGWSHVHSLRFECHFNCKGPQRSTKEAAVGDFEWLRQRCVAQLDNSCEREHVKNMIKELRRTASKGKLQSADVIRPQIASVAFVPNAKLVEVSDESRNKERPKGRICYSHAFVSNPPMNSIERLSGKVWSHDDRYQAWMLARVGDLKSSGVALARAIELAASEFPTNLVAEFCDYEVYPDGINSDLLASLGLGVREDAVITAVDCNKAASRRIPSTREVQELQITAVSRAGRKFEVGSLSELQQCWALLMEENADSFFIYLRKVDKSLRPRRPQLSKEPSNSEAKKSFSSSDTHSRAADPSEISESDIMNSLGLREQEVSMMNSTYSAVLTDDEDPIAADVKALTEEAKTQGEDVD